MYLLLDFQMSKKERVICEFDIDFKKSFCCRSNLSNADNNIIIIVFLPMPGLTTRVENDMFWCEIGIHMLLFLSYSR